jgi:hypothetical protein
VQGNGASGAQNGLAQPAHAEQQQQDADDELQLAQRNPIQEWPKRKYNEGKKSKPGDGADPRRPPTTDKGDREHDCQRLDGFDKRA